MDYCQQHQPRRVSPSVPVDPDVRKQKRAGRAAGCPAPNTTAVDTTRRSANRTVEPRSLLDAAVELALLLRRLEAPVPELRRRVDEPARAALVDIPLHRRPEL